MKNITIAVTYWGDHRTSALRVAYDSIEEKRWRWHVRHNLRRREDKLKLVIDNDLPPFLRRQAL